jgi:hypothetical protein
MLDNSKFRKVFALRTLIRYQTAFREEKLSIGYISEMCKKVMEGETGGIDRLWFSWSPRRKKEIQTV